MMTDEARLLLDAMEKTGMGRIAAVVRDALDQAEADQDEEWQHNREVINRVRGERDAALAEVERLRAERDTADRQRIAMLEQHRIVTTDRDEVRAEVERLRRGEVDGVFTSVVHECCEQVAAVRTLCEEQDAVLSPGIPSHLIRAALDTGAHRCTPDRMCRVCGRPGLDGEA